MEKLHFSVSCRNCTNTGGRFYPKIMFWAFKLHYKNQNDKKNHFYPEILGGGHKSRAASIGAFTAF